jgi:hypothetical protein
MNRLALPKIVFALGACLLPAASVLWACASVPDESRKTVSSMPNQQIFIDHVSQFLERRCGTLDCHGQPGRPLRIYGQYCLRLPNDAGFTPAKGVTSQAEKIANYRAVVGLEPEQLNRVLAGESPLTLLLLQKPLSYGDQGPATQTLGVRHRGGPQLSDTSDDGYKCLADWLEGKFVTGEGEKTSATACRDASIALDKRKQ